MAVSRASPVPATLQQTNHMKHTSGHSDALLDALKEAGATNFYDDIKSLDEQVTSLIEENEDLKSQLDDANSEMDRLKHAIDELESRLQKEGL